MRHSLRLRLLLTMVLVVLATAGTVALLAQQSALSEFQNYIEADNQHAQRLGLLVQQASQLTMMDAAAQQTTIERMASEFSEHIILANAEGVIIADSSGVEIGKVAQPAPLDGTVLLQFTTTEAPGVSLAADPQTPLIAGPSFIAVPTNTLMVQAQPATGSIVYYAQPVSNSLPIGQPSMVQVAQAPIEITWSGLSNPDPIGASFAAGLNRSLMVAVAVAGVVAILLTWLLSRQIIRPVEQLTMAAERMARGDLAHRVAIEANDEIGGLGRAFNSMAAALERAESLRRTLVGDIAHELRTPLTNIQGYLEAMRDGLTRPDPPMIASLYEEALLLKRLIEDLQELSQADAGQLRLVRVPTDLRLLVTQVMRLARPQIEAKGVACRVELPDLPILLSIDSERIGQVLRNLVNNALIHTPEGGCIAVSVIQADHHLVSLRVEDTGCGIAPTDLPLIFERFYRADPSRNRATGGSGLGLSIVRQLVEAHGGSVTVESELGKGSCFYVTLTQP